MRATIGCGRTAHRDTDAYLASSSAAKRACRTPGGVPLRQLSRWLTCARPAGHDRGPELANIDRAGSGRCPNPEELGDATGEGAHSGMCLACGEQLLRRSRLTGEA